MVCLEIFIPGGIVGIAGAVSIGISFWLAYTRVEGTFGFYFVTIGFGFGLLCIFLSIKFFPQTRFSRKLFLGHSEKNFKSSSSGLESLEGKTGITMTKLRPAGMARIEGKRASVITEGAFMEKGTEVRVVRVESNRVIVRKQKKGVL